MNGPRPPLSPLGRELYRSSRALSSSRPALEQLSVARLRKLLGHAARVPLHAERMRRAGVDPRRPFRHGSPEDVLRALPPLRKGELRRAGARALWGGQVRPSWRSSRSSGSTGEPFRMYFDRPAWLVLKHLVKLRWRAFCGLRPHHRVAVVDAVPPGKREPSLPERAGRLRRISALHPPGRIAEELAAFGPDVVDGLPSALLEAAGAGGLAGRLSPERIFTSGELLTADRRAALERAYGAGVLDVYGTSETKEIAWTCPEGSRHVNSDVVRVEVLDETGDPVPAGREGELVATVLVNRALPLLRYRTGDRAVPLDAPCPCGVELPRIGVLTGREAQTVEMGGCRLSPYRFTTALEEVEGLGRYQVRQVARRRLEVRVSRPSGIDPDALRPAIVSAVRDAVPNSVDVEVGVRFVDVLGRAANGKFRIVEPLNGARAVPPAPSAREPDRRSAEGASVGSADPRPDHGV